jgi:hypothetical protein
MKKIGLFIQTLAVGVCCFSQTPSSLAEIRRDVASVVPPGSRNVRIVDKGLRGEAVRVYFESDMSDGKKEFLKRPELLDVYIDKSTPNERRYSRLSPAAIDSIRALSEKSFMVVHDNGRFEFVSESDLMNKLVFERVRIAYNNGKIIQKLGCYDYAQGLNRPKRYAENLHPARTIEESCIEQITGRANKHELPAYLQQFSGFEASKMYRVNPRTGGKGVFLGYIFNVFSMRLKDDAAGRSVILLLKRYISADRKTDAMIVTKLHKMYPSYYFSMDQYPETKHGDIFLMTRLEGLNVSYPHPLAYALFPTDKDLDCEKTSKKSDSFIKKYDRPLLIYDFNIK